VSAEVGDASIATTAAIPPSCDVRDNSPTGVAVWSSLYS
jgi:hypothetical protein